MLMSLPAFIQSVEEALWDAGQARLGADERTGGAFFDGRGGHILLLKTRGIQDRRERSKLRGIYPER